MTDEKKETPDVYIPFIYVICNDIDEMRKFCKDGLGMEEVSYMNTDTFGWLCYQCRGFQLMFFRAEKALPVHDKFTMQPGWEGGEIETISWSVGIPEVNFAETVKRLKEMGYRTFSDEPHWYQDSYWGFPVLDPMGNTIEVFTQPAEKPSKPEWTWE